MAELIIFELVFVTFTLIGLALKVVDKLFPGFMDALEKLTLR